MILFQQKIKSLKKLSYEKKPKDINNVFQEPSTTTTSSEAFGFFTSNIKLQREGCQVSYQLLFGHDVSVYEKTSNFYWIKLTQTGPLPLEERGNLFLLIFTSTTISVERNFCCVQRKTNPDMYAFSSRFSLFTECKYT